MLTALLEGLWQQYPHQTVQDLYKAVFQLCMGPEHLLQSPERALAYLEAEYAAVDLRDLPQEPLLFWLGRDIARLNLRPAKRQGLSVSGIGRAFLASGQIPRDQGLLRTLVEQLTAADLSRFGIAGAEQQRWLQSIADQGLPAVHHSDRYRQLYRPAYRLIHRSTMDG